MEKILECSSKGDKRFSALYAEVSVFGKKDTIENHYQLSKRLLSSDGILFIPKDIKEIKGKQPIFFEINGKKFDILHLTAYYSLLWVKYLDDNKELVSYAQDFDDFSDIFRGKSVNCQSDIIKSYIKEGRSSIMESEKVISFSEKLKSEDERIKTGDLLMSNVDIIAHQVNCMGAMGAGIALSIKGKYPAVYKKYNQITTSYKRKEQLMGRCLFVSEKGEVLNKNSKHSSGSEKVVANLFGQLNYGKGLQTDYEALKQSLENLREFAVANRLSVGVPYKIGCGNAGGDWEVVKAIIDDVFSDYLITIFKLEETN